jgi:hypothetical protein
MHNQAEQSFTFLANLPFSRVTKLPSFLLGFLQRLQKVK